MAKQRPKRRRLISRRRMKAVPAAVDERAAPDREELPFPYREVGDGPHCYVRRNIFDGSVLVVRFQTRAETDAAMRRGMELDHLQGDPPHLIEALLEAARKVAPS